MSKIFKRCLLSFEEISQKTPRCYTMTHNEYTDTLLISIGSTFNYMQFNPFSENMLAYWKDDNADFSLHVHYFNNEFNDTLYGVNDTENLNEKMRLAVDAIHSMDTAFLENNKELKEAPVYMHLGFENKVENQMINRINTNSYLTMEDDANNWFMLGRDPGSTFYAPVRISSDLTLKHDPIIKGNRPSAVVNNILYVADKNEPRKLYAIDLRNNSIKWEFTVDIDSDINSAMAKDNLVFISTPWKIYCLVDLGDSYEVKWTKEIGPGAMSTMTFDDINIYHTYIDNNTTYPINIRKVVAIDINTGADRWTYNLNKDHNPPDALTTGGGKVFFAVDNRMTFDTTLYALDGKTSTVQWTAPLFPSSSPSSHTPVYSDNKIYIDMAPIRQPHTITAFDANTGKTLWKYTLTNIFAVDPFRRGVLSVNDDSVITMDQKGNMIALNKDNGQVRWNIFYADRISIGGKPYIRYTSMPIILSNDKVFIENNGKIKVFDASNGSQLNTIAPTNLKIAPLVIGGKMLITTDGNNLYAFSEKDIVPPMENYIVQSGDTLSKIAQKFSTTVQYLVEINNIGDPNSLYIGQVLKVPTPMVEPPVPTPTPTIKYTVQPGDTLAAIAIKYNTTVKELVALNNILDPNQLYVGQILNVPEPTIQPPVPTPTPTTEYIVQLGDTLAIIAIKHNVTVKEIIAVNNIPDPNQIFIGQRLKIPVKEQIIHIVVPGETLWIISSKYNVPMSTIIEKNNLTNPNSLYVGQKLIIK